MKKIILLISIFASFEFTSAQDYSQGYPNPPTWVKDGVTIWCGYPIDNVIKWADIIFEGRILTDSIYYQNPPGQVFTYHKVLVLKQFKGTYKSDTVCIITGGGRMIINDIWKGVPAYTHVGDEALFWASSDDVRRYKIDDPNLFFQSLGNGCGFLKICDTKDIRKEVYDVLEKALGHPYIDVHPNTCANQKLIQQK
jgi:hypothetical protein